MKLSSGQTLGGNKQEANTAVFTETQTVSGSKQLFLTKLPADSSWHALFPHLFNSFPEKFRFSKNGQIKKKKKIPNGYEVSMLGLCCRAGCLPATFSPCALEGTKLAFDLLSDGLLLREDPQAEICLLVWLKCGWNKNVITRWQLEAVGYFP